MFKAMVAAFVIATPVVLAAPAHAEPKECPTLDPLVCLIGTPQVRVSTPDHWTDLFDIPQRRAN
jgi:hypothetical protein